MDHVDRAELQLDQRVGGHDERHHGSGQISFLMHDDAVLVLVVPAELMTGDDHRHLLVADRQEVLLQLDKAVHGDGEHDDERRDRPRDLEAGMAVDLRRHVAGRLHRSPVPDDDPQQRGLDSDEDDDGQQRDADVGVVDALTVRRDGVGEDRMYASEIAGAEHEQHRHDAAKGKQQA